VGLRDGVYALEREKLLCPCWDLNPDHNLDAIAATLLRFQFL